MYNKVTFEDVNLVAAISHNPEKKNWELDKKYNVFLGTDSRNVMLAGELIF